MDYIDLNGDLVRNESSQDKLLKTLYGSQWGTAVLKVLTQKWISDLSGKLLDAGVSSLLINSFIKNNKINMSDYERKKYHSFNDFFTRRIAYGRRPVGVAGMPDNGIVSPSDGKVTVYKIDDELKLDVKGTVYTLEALLKNGKVAKHFKGGYVYIVRLSVDDYHRYIYPVSGVKTGNYHIDGVYHTVNPVANEHYAIYKENTREYTLIRAKNRGYIVQMEVGALLVGRIVNHHDSRRVTCGEEKGYFEYGGSTIVVMADRNMAEPRKDLLAHTADGYETKILQGQMLSCLE